MSENEGQFANEKDVEEKLVKPLLTKLGFDEKDYVQQMYIEIGNHNYALIPDFVINPTSTNGHYSGYTLSKQSEASQVRNSSSRSKGRQGAMQKCWEPGFLLLPPWKRFG